MKSGHACKVDIAIFDLEQKSLSLGRRLNVDSK